MALTATATPAMIDDLHAVLQCEQNSRGTMLLRSSFRRSNLHLNVQPKHQGSRAIRDLVATIEHAGGLDMSATGIVYCTTQLETEHVADLLRKAKLAAKHFHAHMSKEEKHAVLQAFQTDEIAIVVATIAFGMGIDKPNVRFVIHWNISASLHGYFQEVGRAGRDAQRATCTMFYSREDAALVRSMAKTSQNVQGSLQNAADMEKWAVQQSTCRHKLLLEHFGEASESCDAMCDVCEKAR